MHLALEFSADSGKVSVQFLDLLPGWASSAVLLISQPDVEKPVLLNPCAVTYVGLLWGMCIIMSGNINSGILFGAIVTGAFSWLICYQSKIDLLSLVPNTFMGGFSAFASGGDWKMLCICLVLGNILGVCCDYSGRFLAAKFGKDN